MKDRGVKWFTLLYCVAGCSVFRVLRLYGVPGKLAFSCRV